MEEKNKRLWITIIIVSIIIIGLCGGFLLGKLIGNGSFNNQLANVKKIIKDTYAGRNDFEVNGHTVKIKIWSDGIMSIAKKASEGDAKSIENWNALKDKMYLLAAEITDMFLLTDDAVIYLCYVNEQNPDRELIVYKNKSLVYDVVEEYQKGD